MKRSCLVATVLIVAGAWAGVAFGYYIGRHAAPDHAGSIEFVDCDGRPQAVDPARDRFVLIIGDHGCVTLIPTPPNLDVTCTVGHRGGSAAP